MLIVNSVEGHLFEAGNVFPIGLFTILNGLTKREKIIVSFVDNFAGLCAIGHSILPMKYKITCDNKSQCDNMGTCFIRGRTVTLLELKQ